jgi:DNA topoisomerase IB
MLLIIGKVVLGKRKCFLVPNSNWIAFTIRFTSSKKRNVVDKSLFEDLPALDDYDEKSKKTLWNYFETISSSKRVLSKEENRKERGKDETLFEVDTFITAMYRGT